MKKTIFLIVAVIISLCSRGQIPTQVVSGPGSTYVYVGSLSQNFQDSGNSQKIIVKILGGSWFKDSNGETTYYISNRDGLGVNEVSLGSNTAGRVILRAYQNGGNTDFYLVPTATDYISFAVSSYTFGYGVNARYFEITTQSNVPGSTDITSTLNIVPVLITSSSGNVGIGVRDTHGYKLGVNGGIHAQQVTVDMNDWADYVFKKDYNLISLSELNNYLNQNHHLPDMPSEEQVFKNGVDLGQLNKLLLKKVEELTLYLIDKDKQLSEEKILNFNQQKDIDQMKKQISSLILSKNYN